MMVRVNTPRKTITHKMLNEIEGMAHYLRSVERYSYVRQWLYGNVIDCGCGTGYGSYMIAQNPDIKRVIGFDDDRISIEFAKREYQDGKLLYFCEDITNFNGLPSESNCDWLVAIELIEHLKKPKQLAKLADGIKAERILLTYPSKKTTHYNPYHVKDYNDKMIAKIFLKYQIYREYDFHATHDTKILFLERNKK